MEFVFLFKKYNTEIEKCQAKNEEIAFRKMRDVFCIGARKR